MNETAKAVRRTQVQNELRRIRHSRDDNTISRNRPSSQIEELQISRRSLENYIQNMIRVEERLKQCPQNAPTTEFFGGRRKRVETRVNSTCSNFKNEIQRHQNNLERVNRNINDFSTRLEDVTVTINRQNNRISELEREMRNLR